MDRLNSTLVKEKRLPAHVEQPPADWGQLPVKVLQFGTGVLLRGLPDYFIDKANKQHIFNGRILVVKSTSNGKADGFNEQDGLYTLCVRGIMDGKEVEEFIVNSAIKEVLSANGQWDAILRYAEEEQLQVVISNTTEVGILLEEDDDIFAKPPKSFPGKLLAFLYRRFQQFGNDPERGMVIVPTELISDNGKQLKEIVLKLAHKQRLEQAFINWLEQHNDFCNSLVDRIVPGKLPYAEQQAVEQQLGYHDDQLIMAEPFRLWAIESGRQSVKEILSFHAADAGIVITPNIHRFKELKLRLLNGTHTFSCGLAVLAGFDTVKEALADPLMGAFIKRLLLEEIVPTVVRRGLTEDEVTNFAEKVLDRFRNQSLNHQWINITLNYTSKMEMRNVALIKGFEEMRQAPPDYMALGFAAYLLFMKGKKAIGETYQGYTAKGYYPIQDSYAEYFSRLWNLQVPEQVVDTVLKDQQMWNVNLATLPQFSTRVKAYLEALLSQPIMTVLQELINRE